MRSIKSLAGALAGTLALAGVTALGAAAPASAITPDEARTGAGFGGYSSGEVVHAVTLSTEGAELARTELAQSAAGVGVGQELVDVDELNSRILFADQTGKNAYGHGVGLSTSVGQESGSEPALTLAVAEALSPPPATAEDTVVEVPADELATANVLNADAQANTTSATSICPPAGQTGLEAPLSRGAASAADATVLNLMEPTGSLVTLGGTSESISVTRLVPSGANFGLQTSTTQTVAPLTLLAGTPLETTIEVLADIQLRATALGTGTAEVFYGFVDDAGNPVAEQTPVLEITTGQAPATTTQTLTSQDVFGPNGLQLNLGVLEVAIGGPPMDVVENGTTASANADFIRISVPSAAPVLTEPVFSGPLDPLNGVTDPLLDTLGPVLDPIRQALVDAGLTGADIRVLHTEVLAKVPAGGIICTTATVPDEDPLRNAFKDVSALGVAPGATFDYTVRFPNDGSTALTNVRVVDTFSGGPPPLEFVSSDPAPTSREGNTLTYDIGTIEPGTFRDISFTFRVPANAPVGTRYSNSATITATFDGRQIEKVVRIDAPTVIPTPTGPCSVERSTKFASNTEVETGQEFAYFVNVSNTGGADCTGVVVTDELGSGVSFVSCSDSCTNQGQRVTFQVGTLTGGASRTLKIVVRVTATSGTLPNAADITTEQGATARPTTDGPRITDDSVGNPGKPAGCPASGCPASAGAGRELPRTGMESAVPLLGVVALLLTVVMRRRRGDLIG